METILKLLITVAVGYAIAVAVSTVFQRSLMYFPAKSSPEPAAAGAPDMQVVSYLTFTSKQLVSWYRPARQEMATIVYFHGNAGGIADRVDKVRHFLDAGYGVLLAGYLGFGGNPGTPNEDTLYESADAAMAFLKQQGVLGRLTVIKGESLGSGIATYIAVNYPVAAILLEAPYTSTVDVGADRMPYLPVRWLMYDRFPSIERIASITVPLLIAHGGKDRTIPFKFGKRLFEAANEPKESLFVPGGDHNSLPEFGLFLRELAFLEKFLKAE
jgi:hypothetical protein